MAEVEADPCKSSCDVEQSGLNKDKLADSTTQDSSSSDGRNTDTNGVVSSTSSFGSVAASPPSSALVATTTMTTTPAPAAAATTATAVAPSAQSAVSSSFLQPSRLTFCRPAVTVFGVSTTTSNPALVSSKMMPNPFASRHPLKSDSISSASTTSHSTEGLIAPSRFGLAGTRQADSASEAAATGFKCSVLSPSKFGNSEKNNVVSSSSKFQLRSSVLSPASGLKSCTGVHSSTPNAPGILKPATLPDPKAKNGGGEKESGTSDIDSTSKTSGEATSSTKDAEDAVSSRLKDADESANSDASKADDSPTAPALPSNRSPETNNETSTGTGIQSTGAKGEFIFGQNLQQRVTGFGKKERDSNKPCGSFVFGQNLADRVVQAGRSPSREAAEEADADADDSEDENLPEKACQSLEESAREYQAKLKNKPEYKEVDVKTGEEDESNVLQSNCKLFVFDKTSQLWLERGRGILRLNDMMGDDSEKFQSRLVMRSQGSLRVILNTKIWSGMSVERASQKSIRLTAADGDEGVKVFLIVLVIFVEDWPFCQKKAQIQTKRPVLHKNYKQATPKDSDNILRAIDWRIQQLKTEEEQQRNVEKRKAESQERISPLKKQRKLPEIAATSGESKAVHKEESDSSVLDPETEASNESCTSSQTVRSESD